MRRELTPHVRRTAALWGAALVLLAAPVAGQSGSRPGYDVEYIGPPLQDPVIQQAKETYVLYGCAYCHGVNLVPRGEATDLRASAIVGRDVDANTIGPLLRAGIPQTAKLSPMPQFSDLSDREIRAIATWIHYARAEARFADLVRTPAEAGDTVRGKEDFDQKCLGCHPTEAAFARIGGKYDLTTLRTRMLKPTALAGPTSYHLDRRADTRTEAARRQHQTLLENHTTGQVANLLAYLQSLK